MTSRRLPCPWQVVEAVPMNAWHESLEQFCCAGETPRLHLVGAKGRDAHFADPDGQGGHRADFIDLFWPFVDLPQVPVERESVNGDDVHLFEHAQILQAHDERWIDGRDAAEHARKCRVLLPNGL